jgi:hypothetical protein
MSLYANNRHVGTPFSLFRSVLYDQMPMQDSSSSGSAAREILMICNDKRRWTMVRPLTVGLIGLALAVVLWGIGYRLSLYRPHPAPSARADVAKLWVGPRDSICIKSSRTKATTASNSQLLSAKASTLPSSIGATLQLSTTAAHGSRFRLLLGTLRSPPPRYL